MANKQYVPSRKAILVEEITWAIFDDLWLHNAWMDWCEEHDREHHPANNDEDMLEKFLGNAGKSRLQTEMAGDGTCIETTPPTETQPTKVPPAQGYKETDPEAPPPDIYLLYEDDNLAKEITSWWKRDSNFRDFWIYCCHVGASDVLDPSQQQETFLKDTLDKWDLVREVISMRNIDFCFRNFWEHSCEIRGNRIYDPFQQTDTFLKDTLTRWNTRDTV